jgi:hypothetical protein
MFQSFLRFQAAFSTLQWAAMSVVGVALNFWSTVVLNKAYAASGFPVPYWEAQLSFDHLKLKGWYQALIEKDSLGLYLHAQYVDFLFIASVLLLHVAVLVLVSRMLPNASRARSLMLWAALLSSLAPILDALENLVSFVMLSQPLSFAPALALIYSALAAGKFAMFTFAYVAGGAGVMRAVYSKLSPSPTRESAA